MRAAEKEAPRDGRRGDVRRGLKIAALFDANGKLAGAYRVGDNTVSDLDGAELVKIRAKLMHRKVR
jgi:hypothetical protein